MGKQRKERSDKGKKKGVQVEKWLAIDSDEKVPAILETIAAAEKETENVAKKSKKRAYDKVAGSGVRDLGKLHPDLSRYHRVKTIEGKVHVDIADAVAIELREMSLDQVYEYAAKVLGIPASDLFNKYSKLNQGMQRMNCGNRIRAHFRAVEKREAAPVTDLGAEE